MVDVGMPWVGIPLQPNVVTLTYAYHMLVLIHNTWKKTSFKEFLTLKFNFGNASFHCHKSWSQTICHFLDCWFQQKNWYVDDPWVSTITMHYSDPVLVQYPDQYEFSKFSTISSVFVVFSFEKFRMVCLQSLWVHLNQWESMYRQSSVKPLYKLQVNNFSW